MSESEFQEVFIDALERIDLDAFSLDEDDFESFEDIYQTVEAYAMERQLLNTSVALPLVRAIMSRESTYWTEDSKEASEYKEDFQHCLSVTRMLIDLHIPLPHEEEDILLASAICHILPENLPYKTMEHQITEEYHLHPEIQKIVLMLYQRGGLSESELRKHFRRIQKHKLALLIALASQGDLMGQLHEVSSWNARAYIYQTRNNYFPMCIYAKEHYTDLLGSISVLTEKMRCLIEIAEILLSRYEARENELMQEILMTREENAKLKGLIERHQDAE